VAADLGRRAVGVEASEEYLRLAVARVKKGVRT
jgi:DNA modification methylase